MPGPQPPYVTALSRPEAYVREGIRPVNVEVKQTHVSYLFFTGEAVYKVKKAVDLGFLDFTHLETRKHFCEEELRLNRRYSPSVYLDVVRVTRDEGGEIALNGTGEVIDYAVKMRQLPHGDMLDVRLESGRVSEEDIIRIARRIADVHRESERPRDPDANGGWHAVRLHVEENISQTAAAADRLVDRAVLDDIALYSRAFLEAREPLFRRREAGGRVVDGHGDLHAGQICLDEDIEFIDSLEFSREYRCGDVTADLAFLAMDLDHYGRGDLSGALVDAYAEATGDEEIRELLDFFKCYRAHVRAKVTMLKLNAPGLSDGERARSEAQAGSYLRLARTYALRSLPSPALYIVMGLPGTGKSTVARALAERWGLAVYSSDVERKLMLGLEVTERAAAAPGKGIYRSTVGRRTYARLLDLAQAQLQAKRSVVLDATFGHPPYRQQAVELAEGNGASAWFIECTLAPEEVRKRIEARAVSGIDPSDATFEIYERQRRAWSSLDRGMHARHIPVDTRSRAEDVERQVVQALFAKSLASAE